MADPKNPTAEEADAPEPIAPAATEEPEAPEGEPSQPDYKAIAEAEKARADVAEKAAADLAFKLREGKRQDDTGTVPESEEGDPSKPATVADLSRILDERDQARTKKDQEAAVLQHIRANTTTEEEAQAAFQTYRSRIVASGNPEEDGMLAIGAVHARKIAGQSQEAARAHDSAATASRDAAEGHHDPMPGQEPQLSPQDATAIRAAGFQWDGKTREYRKPLDKAGKKFLVYDPRTKKRRLVQTP